MRKLQCRGPAILILSALLWGCGGDEPVPVRSTPAEGEAGAPPGPAALRFLAADTVRGWTGPGGRPFEVTRRTPGDPAHLYREIGQVTFGLAARLQDDVLIQYPCTSCHEGVVLMEERIPDAHRNIQPEHPSTTAAACATCHAPDSVQRLSLAEGGTVSMDHAYRLCSRCHSSELEDWAAGVHGKRLMGWSGRRVVMNCADCHDPHSPAIRGRIPYPGPQLPRTDLP